MLLRITATRLINRLPSSFSFGSIRRHSIFTSSAAPQSRHIVIQTDGCLYRKSTWIHSDRAGIGIFFAADHPENVALPVPLWQLTASTTMADIKMKAITLAVLLGSWQREAAHCQDDKITVLTDCSDLIQHMSLAYRQHAQWLSFKHVAPDLVSNALMLAEKASHSSEVSGKLL